VGKGIPELASSMLTYLKGIILCEQRKKEVDATLDKSCEMMVCLKRKTEQRPVHLLSRVEEGK
jgi:hypothetical protein